jgi:hypothetical protein
MRRNRHRTPVLALRRSERIFARAWKLLALRGAIAIAFAFVLLVWPDIGLTAMVAMVGAFALASGFMSGVAASVPARRGDAAARLAGRECDPRARRRRDRAALARPLGEGAPLCDRALGDRRGRDRLVAAFVLPLSGTRTVLVALAASCSPFGVVMFVEPGDGAIARWRSSRRSALVRGTFDIALAVEPASGR